MQPQPDIAVEFIRALPEPIGWLPSDGLCWSVGASPWVFEVLLLVSLGRS